jgi:hypothetical protein
MVDITQPDSQSIHSPRSWGKSLMKLSLKGTLCSEARALRHQGSLSNRSRLKSRSELWSSETD